MAKDKIKKYKISKILDYFGVAFLGLFLLFVWQLYKGPIEVPYLKPYIVKALNSDEANYQISVGSVNIELVRSIQPIKIIANNIIYKKKDESFIINAPRTSVSFSIRGLLRGIVAPSSIEVEKPRIYAFMNYGVEADKKNEINKKKLEYYFAGVKDFLERFDSDDKYYAENYINSIAIKNAEVEIHEVELGRKWTLSDVNYNFERNFSSLETSAEALMKINNRVSSVGVNAEFRSLNEDLQVSAYFSDIVPADLLDNILESGKAQDFYQVNLPVSGRVESTIALKDILDGEESLIDSLDKSISKINFQLEGGAGDIMFNDDERMRYQLSSFMLNGDITGGLNNLQIKGAEFDLGGLKTTLGFKVSGLKEYILENSLKDLKASITADIKELGFDDLPRYWPKYIVESAWSWCEDSLFVGKAQNAHFQFDFAYDNKSKNFTLSNLDGKVDVADVSVNYLKEMPNIENVYGQALFSKDSIKVNIDKGVSQGVILTGGYVDLYDLDKNNNYADIKLIMESSVIDALKLIDNPPLYFVRDMKIPADKLSGRAETDLGLKFELKDNLGPDEVKADVKAKLTDVVMKNVIEGTNLTAQTMSLQVSNDSLELSGEAVVDDIPASILWKENFRNQAAKTRYELAFRLDDKVKQKLGVADFELLSAPYIEGYADVKAIINMSDKKDTQIDISANLNNAAIDYSFLGFRKLEGATGGITAKLIFSGSKLKDIPNFTLSKADFNLQGKIGFGKQGNIQLIDIYKIRGPRTNAKAKIEWQAAQTSPEIKINVSGESYDLSEFFAHREEINKEKYEARQQQPTQSTADDEDELENVSDTDIFIAVNNLWTNPHVPISNFAGTAKLRNGIGLYEAHLVGNYGNSKEVKFKADYDPRPNNEYLLTINSNNAGSTLKVLRIYDSMKGGILKIEGKRNANKEFVGHASIRDFNIKDTPVLAKVLSMASLTGIVGMLSGEGIAFSHFDAPFEYKDKVFTVSEGKAFGNVIGITMEGTYNRNTDYLKGKGVIVPAYSINSFIGKIPVIGNILSGKDGSVFAANYSVKGEISDPEVKINPLSALTPSSLKDLFSSLFESKNDVRISN